MNRRTLKTEKLLSSHLLPEDQLLNEGRTSSIKRQDKNDIIRVAEFIGSGQMGSYANGVGRI